MLRIILPFLIMVPFLRAQTPHAALASSEAFMAEIVNKKWECSFTAYPQVRFLGDKIEAMAADAIISTLSTVSTLEPGIVCAQYKGGSQAVYVFGDDLQTFVLGTMSEMDEFSVAGGASKLPVVGEGPLEVDFKENPFWKKIRVHADKVEVLDAEGKVFATHEAYAFLPQVLGVVLPEKRVGMVVLSRQRPGMGWFLSGKLLGTGVRTDKSGYFRPVLKSTLTGFALRSVQFSYALLNAGYESLASGQERYGMENAANYYGETSEKVAEAWNHIGTLRGYRRSYAKAPEYHQKALDHLKTHLSSDKAKILEYSTDLAGSRNDNGDFAGAKTALAEAHPLLASGGDDFRSAYLFYQQLGMAEFGLRNHSQAARLFLENAKRAEAAKMTGNVTESLLYAIPCQMMQNQTAQAEASLKQCMQVQDERTKANPNYDYDTWKLAFACVALGKNAEAEKYAPTRKRQNWVAYEEYGRMVSLFHGNDRTGAQSLAKDFMGRFSNIQEINIRNDIDPIAVKLTEAIAEQTPQAIAALEQVWAAQVDSLRNRPLKNYVFAKVMMTTLARLKSGK